MCLTNNAKNNNRKVHNRRKNIKSIAEKIGLKSSNTGFWDFHAKNSKSTNHFNFPYSIRTQNNTDRIIGCIAPLSVPDSICTSGKETVVGSWVANVELMESILKYTAFDFYHFLEGSAYKLNAKRTKTDNSEDEIANYLHTLGVNPQKVRAYHLANNINYFENTKYYAIHKPSVDVMHLASLRSSLKSLIAPITGMIHSISYSTMMYWWLDLLLANVLPCDAIVCTSIAGRKALESTFEIVSDRLSTNLNCKPPVFNGRLEIIPLGVDVDYWKPNPDKALVRKLLKLPDNSCIILCAGRFSVHDKMDHGPLLVAIRKLLDIYGDDSFKLILIGDCSQQKWNYAYRVKELIHELGLTHIVKLETSIAQLAMKHYFEAADIFVSLSDGIQETFGLTVTQAMACGLPVVVSDWNGYKDTVVHNETGFRVKTIWSSCDKQISNLAFFRPIQTNQLYLAQTVAIDIDELVDYLDVLISNPDLRRCFGDAGRKRVEKLYSWPIIMKQYMQLWDNSHEIFKKLENLNFSQMKRDDFKNPSYFKRFSHYASEIIGPKSALALTDIGFELISQKNLVNRFVACDEIRLVFYPLIFEKLASKLIYDIEIELHNLVQYVSEETTASPELVIRHIMWLIKYGAIKINH